jgi:hypothetical protein
MLVQKNNLRVIFLLLFIIIIILYFYNESTQKNCPLETLGERALALPRTNNNIFCCDLDGTLIKGDITEGNKFYFPGITEYLYSQGQVQSTTYPTFEKYSEIYFKRINMNDISAFLMPYEIYNTDQDPFIYKYWEDKIQYYFVDYIFLK